MRKLRQVPVLEVRLSDASSDFMALAYDLLRAVENADRALITDETLEAADAFRRFIDSYPREL